MRQLTYVGGSAIEWRDVPEPKLTDDRDALVRREFLSLSQIPYTAHLSEHVIRTKAGDYVQVFRLSGASFESADDEQLNNWHERLAIAFRAKMHVHPHAIFCRAFSVAIDQCIFRVREPSFLPGRRPAARANARPLTFDRSSVSARWRGGRP